MGSKRQFPALEAALFEWISAQTVLRKNISADIIRQKGRQLQAKANTRRDEANQLNLGFSKVWMSNFKKRLGLKSFRSHGEAGDVDESLPQSRLPGLQAKVEGHDPRYVFNADDTRIFYCMPPDRTIATHRLPGRKKEKKRIYQST